MIAHSNECRSAWMIADLAEMERFDAAWHYTCDAGCVNEFGEPRLDVEAQDATGSWCGPCGLFHTTAGEARSHAAALAGQGIVDSMVEALRTPIPTSIFTDKENPMPERHTVVVRNTVQRFIYLNDDLVLETEDRTERTLFFEAEELAQQFISDLAEPEPEPAFGGICPSTSDFGDGVLHRCDRLLGHAGQHEARPATGGYWSWP